MAQIASIKLLSPDYAKLQQVCSEIKGIAIKTGAHVAGPIPLPTKKLSVSTLRTPCGDGSKTWERWQMRVHKRLIDLDADERALRQLMRIQVPDGVNIEIVLRS